MLTLSLGAILMLFTRRNVNRKLNDSNFINPFTVNRAKSAIDNVLHVMWTRQQKYGIRQRKLSLRNIAHQSN